MLEMNGEGQLEQSCKKLNVSKNQGGKKHPTYKKRMKAK